MTKVMNLKQLCKFIGKNSFYNIERVKEIIEEKGSEYFNSPTLKIKYLGFNKWEVNQK